MGSRSSCPNPTYPSAACPNPTYLSAGHAEAVGTRAARAAYVTADGVDNESDLADLDLHAVAAGIPVRLPPSYAGQRSYPGPFWSSTNGGHVVYESRLELDWLWLADFDPNVIRIAPQPLMIVGADGAGRRVRYPDFLTLDASGGALIVDVKPSSMLDDQRVRDSLSWTARVLGEVGFAYAVWSGAPAVFLRNLRLAASARRPGLVPREQVDACADLCPEEGTTLGRFEAHVAASQPGLARQAIFAALWTGSLRCNMSGVPDSGVAAGPLSS